MRSTSATDEEFAPLAVPAITVGAVMMVAVIVTADRIPGWGRDYGEFLVFLALAVYLGLAAAVAGWGVGMRRAVAARESDGVRSGSRGTGVA
ncbi:hypothetical protein [Nocardia mexicana]|uniref:Uncharacterized protein n=1 Tax=Nocardia mexicana TaxID=279262 RepID=A0A370HIB4_9NOCA|nr:hypothetical protein [Nocardia mexicana]RDI55209.1 hypothetical protein DFR68_10141 [Nocardia mexicana]